MLKIESIHHVSLPVSNLERSRRFYAEVLELQEIERPPFDFPGAWYALGDRQLHLIVGHRSTFRERAAPDSRDVHVAIRVASWSHALEHLAAKGYRPDAVDPPRRTIEKPAGTVGYPQVFVIDPDHNTIEINAERLD